MTSKYDTIVIGMGPGAIFFAYEMIQKNKNKKILLVEQGKRVENRKCPIEEIGKCVKCKPFCNITSGFSGAGAFSDGKLSLYNEEDDDIYVGGELHKYVGIEETKKLIDYTDSIYLKFGADPKLEGTEHKTEVREIKKTGKVTRSQYRAITGACSFGINKFCEQHNIQDLEEIELEKLRKILINDYGAEKFWKLIDEE